MKKIVDYIIEAKKYDLNGKEVKKGQNIEIKSWRDDGSTMIVTYLKPHESGDYFYCLDNTGSVKAFKKDVIVKIIDDDKVKKMSRDKSKSIKKEIKDFELRLQELMYDQEDLAGSLDDPNLANENPRFNKIWKEIDKITDKIVKLRGQTEKVITNFSV